MKPLIFAILVLSLFLLAMQLPQAELVFHRDNINHGQWWRIVSGNLTHSNYPHLFLNLAGLWVFGLLFIDSLKIKTFIASTLFLCVFIGGCLYFFNPELLKYYGFSGVLYGLFLIGAISALFEKDFYTGILVALLVIGKVIWDIFNGGSTSSAELIGIPVAVDAHLYGVIGASMISLILFIIHLRNTKPDTKQSNRNRETHPPAF